MAHNNNKTIKIAKRKERLTKKFIAIEFMLILRAVELTADKHKHNIANLLVFVLCFSCHAKKSFECVSLNVVVVHSLHLTDSNENSLRVNIKSIYCFIVIAIS